MIRVILFLAAVLALATGLSWLADKPGAVRIDWEGYVIETSMFRAVVLTALTTGTALVLWSVVRHIWHTPAAFGNVLNRRRNKRGLEALSAGMIAVGSGDRAGATRYALLARKSLPNEPMTHLLRAQAAQLAGDTSTSRRIFEAMLASPDTEPLGLRGLFLDAERERETEAARQFAERALRLNPRLLWASDALFEIQCRGGDWAGALETLHAARKNGLIEKPVADRRRAVLLTAQAIKAEDREPDKALALATEAHALAPNLVPAAAQAGRMLASRGNTQKAANVLEKTWAKCPHPDLATVYAYARVGDSPRDRLVRVKRLASQNPYSIESAIAVANAAIDARAFDEARDALKPMLDGNLTQRIATLMARVESEQFGDKGRVREWLARAVNAPRDQAWTADGVVADEWSPISPVTGALDAFQWRVPVETLASRDGDLIARRVEELVALGAPAPISAVANDVETVDAEPVTARMTPVRGAAHVASRDTTAAVGKTSDGDRSGRPSAATAQPSSVAVKGTGAQTAAPASVLAQGTAPGADVDAVAKAGAGPTSGVAKPVASATTASVPTTASNPQSSTIKSAAIASAAPPSAAPPSAAPPSAPSSAARPAVTPPPVAPAASAAKASPATVVAPAPANADLKTPAVQAPAPAEPRSTTGTAVLPAVKPDLRPASPEAASGKEQSPAQTVPEASKDSSKLAAAIQAARQVSPATVVVSDAGSGAKPATKAGADVARDGMGRDGAGRDVVGRDVPPPVAPAPSKEPRIFVVPHAPDDPGPDGADADPVPAKGNRPPYRALP